MDTKDITKGKIFLMGDLIEDEHDNQITRLQGVFNLEEERANGLLICEAFNVANETGLSPTQMSDRIKELEGEKDKLYSENDMKKIVKWINVRCSEPVDALGKYPFQGKLYDLDSIFEIYKRDYYEKL